MKKITVIVLIIATALLIAGSKPKVTAYGYDTCLTLWDLADKHCPENMDKRDFIEAVVRLNNMSGHTVYAGQIYQYPIYGE